MENPDHAEIDRLKALLKELELKNSNLYHELQELKTRIERFSIASKTETAPPENPKTVQTEEKIPVRPQEAVRAVIQQTPTSGTAQQAKKPPVQKGQWERFIGENLINKIGILITVIGVAIGTKYAFDHQLISPPMRIVLGYLLGGGLMFFALKLKAKYVDFSAVLLSGSMAIFYFLTYISFSFYHFFPIQLTFLLMVIFTAFTVFSAIKYDRQVIAHLGLVGAYAIPFLLSDGSGKILFFFSYVTIINIGILVVSFFKNWKSLIYAAFGFSWGIFLAWYSTAYKGQEHFITAFIFVCLFFVVFYAIGLVYKLVRHEKFHASDMVVIMANSMLFYGLGYSLLLSDNRPDTQLAVFTLINALFHLGVTFLLHRQRATDRTIYYFSLAMTLLFVTLTVPLLFDGNRVTLSWTFEFLALFLVGRLRKISMLEEMSYPVFLLAFMNLLLFWGNAYGLIPVWDWSSGPVRVVPTDTFLLNSDFGTSFAFLVAIGTAFYVNDIKKYQENFEVNRDLFLAFRVLLVIILLVSVFGICFLEINRYWEVKAIALKKDHPALYYEVYDIVQAFELISKIAFGLLFTAVVLWLRRKKQNSSEFNAFAMILSSLALFVFLTFGLYKLSFLQLQYIFSDETYYAPGVLLLVRYLMYALVAFFAYVYLDFIRKQLKDSFSPVFSEFMVHLLVVWVLSAELVNWMHIFNSGQVYKLGLSIFWGIYSLILIVIGIRQKKAYLRIGAISLFGVTLIKLFLYDLDKLSTLGKTVLFIILGVILLVISFLYNKYKGILFEDEQKANEVQESRHGEK